MIKKSICISLLIVSFFSSCNLIMNIDFSTQEKLSDSRFNGDFIYEGNYGSSESDYKLTYKFDGTNKVIYKTTKLNPSPTDEYGPVSTYTYEFYISNGQFCTRLWNGPKDSSKSYWSNYHFSEDGNSLTIEHKFGVSTDLESEIRVYRKE